MTESESIPRVLALVGMPGAGKSVCAKHLEEQGYFQFRFGSIVVNEVVRRGWEVMPENERAVREEIRENEGMDAMATRALPLLNEALKKHNCIIIDGLYSWSEYRTLRGEFGAGIVLVAVACSRRIRYSRIKSRAERPFTEEEAERRDYKEIENLEKGGPIAFADFTLLNNGALDELLDSLDRLMAQLGLQP